MNFTGNTGLKKIVSGYLFFDCTYSLESMFSSVFWDNTNKHLFTILVFIYILITALKNFVKPLILLKNINVQLKKINKTSSCSLFCFKKTY